MKKKLAMVLSMMCLLTASASAQTTDVKGYENVVYLETKAATANSQVEVSVMMNNIVSVAGFEFNISLPEGVTIPKEDDEYLIDLSTERTTYKKHNIFDSALKEDGTIYVLCNSTKSSVFDGNSGEVATVTFELGDVQPGTYYVTLKNVIITKSDATTIKPGNITSAITVGDNGTAKLNAYGFGSYASNYEHAVPAGVSAYTASIDEDSKTITWSLIDDGIIPAGEGVLLKGEANATVTLAASSTEKAKIAGNSMKANLSAKTKSELGEYIYVLSGESIMRLSGSGTLAANKAYFNLSKYVTSGMIEAKSFSIVWDDDATAIKAVESCDSQDAYNLNGIRTKADSKGFVIVGGRKIYNK